MAKWIHKNIRKCKCLRVVVMAQCPISLDKWIHSALAGWLDWIMYVRCTLIFSKVIKLKYEEKSNGKLKGKKRKENKHSEPPLSMECRLSLYICAIANEFNVFNKVISLIMASDR